MPQIIPEKIKIAAAGDLTTAVNRVNSYAPNIPEEVEVTELDKLSKLARPSPPGDEPHMRQVKQIGTAISARG
ncbi:MAG: hypothetical protein GY943_36215 [Chloroflexi bacterium]|nr:hypothetical protein [Chloroflexota bacterium]